MKMFVEYGVISAILLIVIWIDAIRRTMRLWKRRGSDQAAKIWGGFLLAFLIPLFAILGDLVTKTQVRIARRGYAGPAASDCASGWRDLRHIG